MSDNQRDYEQLFKEERRTHRNLKKKASGRKKFRKPKKQSDYRKRARRRKG